LRLAQYSEAALNYLCNIYDFALQIFTGRLRGSGKPFLSHLVGTASILATLDAPTRVVAAGLLHDLGVLYCGNAEYRQEYIRSSLYLSIEMAQKLGFPTLAIALDCAFRECLAVQLPTVMRRGRNASFLLMSA
jgi:predicted HD phosphohydrolase